MKRLRIYIGLAGCCLALCAALTAMAARSFWRQDHAARNVAHERSIGKDSFYSLPGRLVYRGIRHSLAPFAQPERIEAQYSYRFFTEDRQRTINQGLAWRFLTGSSTPSSLGDWLRFRVKRVVPLNPQNMALGQTLVEWDVEVPYWFLIAVTGAPGILLAIKARRLQRFRPGLCATCGYDLRATPDRCPECGMVP